MAEIKAAGCVLFRREAGTWRYLLLHNARHGDIGLPKGHLKPGETEIAGCVRETLEETGIIVEPNAWFERRTRYEVEDGMKEVVYFVAEADREEVRLSNEHTKAEWLDLLEALKTVRHRNLTEVLWDAAGFLKDPGLRGTLLLGEAQSICESLLEPHIVAHTAQVADMALALAEPMPGVDSEFVEDCAWLHDIGRSVDHPRHPIEGFKLLDRRSLPGYAAPCVSHYTKGRPHAECGPMADELWRTIDCSTFNDEEKMVALADFLAAQDRRVTLEARHADLRDRYGSSRFLDRSLEISLGLKRDWEFATGLDLYRTLSIS